MILASVSGRDGVFVSQVDGFIDARRRTCRRWESGHSHLTSAKISIRCRKLQDKSCTYALGDTSKELAILVRIEVADPMAEPPEFLALDTEKGANQFGSEDGSYPV